MLSTTTNYYFNSSGRQKSVKNTINFNGIGGNLPQISINRVEPVKNSPLIVVDMVWAKFHLKRFIFRIVIQINKKL